MNKYIDAEKLKAEIERLKEEYNESIPVKVPNDKMEATKVLLCMGKVEVLNKVLCILDSLQQEQPKVDLEKEIKNEIDEYWYDNDYGAIQRHGGTTTMEISDVKEIARHFFELGRNARKEE